MQINCIEEKAFSSSYTSFIEPLKTISIMGGTKLRVLALAKFLCSLSFLKCASGSNNVLQKTLYHVKKEKIPLNPMRICVCVRARTHTYVHIYIISMYVYMRTSHVWKSFWIFFLNLFSWYDDDHYRLGQWSMDTWLLGLNSPCTKTFRNSEELLQWSGRL